MGGFKWKRKLTSGDKRSLRRLAMLVGSVFSAIILIAWGIHDDTLTHFVKGGKYLDGVVTGKDTRVESGAKGSSTTHYLVWVGFDYDGHEQRILTSKYITESQWEGLMEGDSVSLIYQPKQMYVAEDGEIWFQEGPILEIAFQPALDRLRIYPILAYVLLWLGFLPTIVRVFRRKKKKGA